MLLFIDHHSDVCCDVYESNTRVFTIIASACVCVYVCVGMYGRIYYWYVSVYRHKTGVGLLPGYIYFVDFQKVNIAALGIL